MRRDDSVARCFRYWTRTGSSAGVSRHGFRFREAALRTGDGRLKKHRISSWERTDNLPAWWPRSVDSLGNLHQNGNARPRVALLFRRETESGRVHRDAGRRCAAAPAAGNRLGIPCRRCVGGRSGSTMAIDLRTGHRRGRFSPGGADRIGH